MPGLLALGMLTFVNLGASAETADGRRTVIIDGDTFALGVVPNAVLNDDLESLVLVPSLGTSQFSLGNGCGPKR